MITPDERAEWRALADAATQWPWETTQNDLTDEIGVVHDQEYRVEVAFTGMPHDKGAQADADFIAAARTAVPRLLDALDAAEAETVRLRAERRCSDMEVYAETWNAGYENAMAQGLADDPTLADDWLVEHDERVRRAAEAERDQARAELAVARQHQREASLTIRSVEGLRKERDDALAKVDRQAERLRAREEQVRRLRAEVTRLHALVADLRAARPAPVWDEDTVTEAVARAMYFEDCGVAPSAEVMAGEDYEPFREYARVAVAVVREHTPVRPDREALVRAIAPESVYLTEHHPELQPSNPETFARARAQVKVADAAARRMLAEWPGESRATVQAEALRDAAAAAVAQDNNQGDWWDDDRQTYGTPVDWLRARADRLDPKEK